MVVDSTSKIADNNLWHKVNNRTGNWQDPKFTIKPISWSFVLHSNLWHSVKRHGLTSHHTFLKKQSPNVLKKCGEEIIKVEVFRKIRYL